MSKAIIVVGNELRFLRHGEQPARYLRQIVGRVCLIKAGYRTPVELRNRLAREFALARHQPLLLAYLGHGRSEGWGHALEDPGRYVHYAYTELADLVDQHEDSLLLMNDCCHAGALCEVLDDVQVDPSRISLIATCSSARVSKPGMAARVIASWKRQAFYEPTWEAGDTDLTKGLIPDQEFRWGTGQLDRLYFARP